MSRRMSERVTKDIRQPFEDLRERMDAISGNRPGITKIKKLGPTASLEECILKINEIIDRIQGS